jgi:hypothetical protein
MSCNPNPAAITKTRAGLALAHRLCAFCLIISAVVLVSTVARAQPLKPRVNLKQYHELVRQAVDQYERGNYEESKVFFTEAHRVFPNARTMRGLGMVAYTVRDYVKAIPYLEDAISSTIKPLDPPLVVEARETIARARTFIGIVRVTLAPADAKIVVDASPVTRATDGALMLNPGRHEIEASAPGYQSATRLVRVEPGAVLQIDLALSRATGDTVAARRAQTAPEAVASIAPTGNEQLEAAPAQKSDRSLAPWIVVGVSGAVVIGGGVLLGIALNDVAVVEDSQPTTDWSKVEGKYRRTPALSTAGIVMIGAGIAGVAGGLTWQFLEHAESEVALDVSPLGMQVHGTW